MDELLAAIRRDLDDDAPRLVYADVLQRAGDPRGELIAVQCELARLVGDRHHWAAGALWEEPVDVAAEIATVAALRAREDELITASAGAWIKPLMTATVNDVGLARGFVDSAAWSARGVAPEAAGAALAALFARAPMLSALSYRPAPAPDPERLARLQAFLDAPELGQLRRLELDGIVDRRSAEFVADCTTLGSLRRLSLGAHLADDTLPIVLRGEFAGQLEELEVQDCRVGATGAWAVASTTTRLRHLALRSAQLGDDAAVCLAEAPGFAGLRTLALPGNALEAGGVQTLAEAPALQGLVALDLRYSRLGVEGVRAIAASFPALRQLDLGATALDDRAVDALVGSGLLGRLRQLDLRHNSIGDGAVVALATRPPPPRLRVLQLPQTEVSAAAVARLAAAWPETRVSGGR